MSFADEMSPYFLSNDPTLFSGESFHPYPSSSMFSEGKRRAALVDDGGVIPDGPAVYTITLARSTGPRVPRSIGVDVFLLADDPTPTHHAFRVDIGCSYVPPTDPATVVFDGAATFAPVTKSSHSTSILNGISTVPSIITSIGDTVFTGCTPNTVYEFTASLSTQEFVDGPWTLVATSVNLTDRTANVAQPIPGDFLNQPIVTDTPMSIMTNVELPAESTPADVGDGGGYDATTTLSLEVKATMVSTQVGDAVQWGNIPTTIMFPEVSELDLLDPGTGFDIGGSGGRQGQLNLLSAKFAPGESYSVSVTSKSYFADQLVHAEVHSSAVHASIVELVYYSLADSLSDYVSNPLVITDLAGNPATGVIFDEPSQTLYANASSQVVRVPSGYALPNYGRNFACVLKLTMPAVGVYTGQRFGAIHFRGPDGVFYGIMWFIDHENRVSFALRNPDLGGNYDILAGVVAESVPILDNVEHEYRIFQDYTAKRCTMTFDGNNVLASQVNGAGGNYSLPADFYDVPSDLQLQFNQAGTTIHAMDVVQYLHTLDQSSLTCTFDVGDTFISGIALSCATGTIVTPAPTYTGKVSIYGGNNVFTFAGLPSGVLLENTGWLHGLTPETAYNVRIEIYREAPDGDILELFDDQTFAFTTFATPHMNGNSVTVSDATGDDFTINVVSVDVSHPSYLYKVVAWIDKYVDGVFSPGVGSSIFIDDFASNTFSTPQSFVVTKAAAGLPTQLVGTSTEYRLFIQFSWNATPLNSKTFVGTIPVPPVIVHPFTGTPHVIPVQRYSIHEGSTDMKVYAEFAITVEVGAKIENVAINFKVIDSDRTDAIDEDSFGLSLFGNGGGGPLNFELKRGKGVLVGGQTIIGQMRGDDNAYEAVGEHTYSAAVVGAPRQFHFRVWYVQPDTSFRDFIGVIDGDVIGPLAYGSVPNPIFNYSSDTFPTLQLASASSTIVSLDYVIMAVYDPAGTDTPLMNTSLT